MLNEIAFVMGSLEKPDMSSSVYMCKKKGYPSSSETLGIGFKSHLASSIRSSLYIHTFLKFCYIALVTVMVGEGQGSFR